MANKLYGWGNNGNGRIGDGTTETRYEPTPIGTDTWAMVSCGDTHSLGFHVVIATPVLSTVQENSNIGLSWTYEGNL